MLHLLWRNLHGRVLRQMLDKLIRQRHGDVVVNLREEETMNLFEKPRWCEALSSKMMVQVALRDESDPYFPVYFFGPCSASFSTDIPQTAKPLDTQKDVLETFDS